MSMISFHASSFIRINRLSRVIPALSIRMPMSPKRCLDGGKDGFDGFLAGHVQCHATALLAQIGADRLGTALAGRGPHSLSRHGPQKFPAIARPMPRLAPVTSTTLSVKLMTCSCLFDLGQRLLERGGIVGVNTFYARIDALASPVNTLPGP